jgi:pimeloyl-ACP methyl ester carboxylesterase
MNNHNFGEAVLKKLACLFIGLFVLTMFSCVTISKINPYPNIATVTYGNNTAYEFRNAKTDKLFIYLEGSGLNSVMGTKDEKRWYSINFGYFIVQALQDTYNIIIPEKFNMHLGGNYVNNPEIKRMYTIENLAENYARIINSYLSEHTYSSVILSGQSEGACVLPLVYGKIIDKERITSMVALAYGGLSLYEQRKILADSELPMPEEWKDLFRNTDEYKKDIELSPNSLGDLAGLPYIWYNSILDYRPYDSYVNINIPVLFIHGERDVNVPVESTRYIQENLPNKPFDYLYCEDADHNFATPKAIKMLRQDAVRWISEHS